MATSPPSEGDGTNGLLKRLLKSTDLFREEVQKDFKEQRKEITELREDFNSARLEDVTIRTEIQIRSRRNTEDLKELRSPNRAWRWGEGVLATILTALGIGWATLKGQ